MLKRSHGKEKAQCSALLTNQQIARSVERQDRLLLGRLDRDEAHGRARHRLADRLRISCVRLAPLDVGFDVNRRHQFHLVPQSRDLTRPEVARAARLDADQTGLQLGEERHHLAPAQRSADDDLAGVVDAVDLENVLGQIDADGGYLHGG